MLSERLKPLSNYVKLNDLVERSTQLLSQRILELMGAAALLAARGSGSRLTCLYARISQYPCHNIRTSQSRLGRRKRNVMFDSVATVTPGVAIGVGLLYPCALVQEGIK